MNKKIILGSCFLAPLMLQAQPSKPNIVIILADDLGWGDVGFHGSSIQTPCLDQLVDEGVELSRFYTSPISSPSRAGLLTGRYPNRFGFRQAVIPPWRKDGLDVKEETIANLLERNGYKNRAVIGKWHLGHTYKEHYPMNRGFTHFYGHLNGAIDYFTHEREGELDWHNDWNSCYDKGYATELLTQEAVKCIQNYSKEGPFFLYIAYNAPHSPFQAQQKDIELYCNNYDELSPDEQKKVTYKAMVSCMDRGIGQIVETLKKQNLMDNTLILFYSDNGAALGPCGASSGKLRNGKFTEWDGGVRSPAILYWKDCEPYYDQIASQLTGFVDVAPTVKELVGDQTIPQRAYDGMSMMPILTGKAKKISRCIYLGNGAVVSDNYKLIKKDYSTLKIDVDFLVDYKNDPYERVNASKIHPSVVEQLSAFALRYDTITPCIPEVSYDKGKKGFKAPKEWDLRRKQTYE